MATLNLTKVWVNRLDTGQAVSAQTAPDRTRSATLSGEVRGYAGGRQRAFSTAGQRGKFECVLLEVPLATVLLLESWMGVPVQVRDHRGQRFVGAFFAVPATEHKDDLDAYDVALDLSTVTVPDGV